MTIKKKNPTARTPDMTVEGDSLVVFTDKPRAGRTATSTGVATRFDPAVAELDNLARTLDNCLRTARTIKNKRATELVKLLRVAQRQVVAFGTK
jgi:hypothetical protein